MLYNENTKANYLLDEFDEHFKKNGHSKYSRNQLLAESQIVRTSLAFNDMSQIIAHSKAAYDLLDGKVSLIRKRTGVYTYGCPHFSYMYYNKPGNYRSLIQEISSSFDYHIRACNGCGAGASPLSSAEYYLETGSFEKVEGFALEAQYISRQYEQTCIMIASSFTLARLYQIQGRKLELNQTIEEMERLCQFEKNPLNSNVLDNALGYLYTLLGKVEKIPAWLREDNITYCFSTYQGTAFNHLVYQMTLIQQKDYETFLQKKHTFLLDFKQFQNQLGIACFHINHAIVLYHTKGLYPAASELTKALNIAQQDHLILIFAENAQELLPILEHGTFDIDPSFLSELIDACRGSLSVSSNMAAHSILSKREVDIMELLQQGASIPDIADTLYISKNTVKRHLQNIYRKFDVHNKTLAIKLYCDIYKIDPAD